MNDQAPQWFREPIAPPPYVSYAHKLGRGMLTFAQVEELVKAINTQYVATQQNMTYLAQHQARAEMNRIFGYANWDVEAAEPVLLYETQEQGTGNKANKTYWKVAYRIAVTVRIRDLWGMPLAEYTGVHAEENAPQPNRGEAHALALTSVDSYALRRALINLGDRFGLGLYNGGSTAPHGQYTVQLQNDVLFRWKEVSQESGQAASAAAPQQPTHETISAEPAAPEHPGLPSDYDDAEPDGHGGVRSREHAARMNAFNQAQQAQQAARDTARQQGAYPAAGGDMQSRLQSGFRVDERDGVVGGGEVPDGPSA